MPLLTVYGSSDDLIEFDGILGADEFNVNSDEPEEFLVISPEGSFRIIGHYDGTWSFAIALIDDGIKIPDVDVKVKYSPHNDYSTQLLIEVPEGTYLYRRN